ncbi:hypothetical protein SCLCIDRAFT_908452 [Scleroderma citrinum Foug A]|uniref:Uncharacterized protein n=1 Tax=Scleroderma citrinum Foug A TaxID=1036808 RepID=A0A0C3DKV2_9AGAM|nr:hypothetical protein SCLCIDRAFT_908452 [Scleroderma citrinum Foug A]
MSSGFGHPSMYSTCTHTILKICMLPTALEYSFCHPLHIHIHERISRLNRRGSRYRNNLIERCHILDPEQTSLAHLPPRPHQYGGVPVRVQCAENMRAKSAAWFVVLEETVSPADDGEHLIV